MPRDTHRTLVHENYPTRFTKEELLNMEYLDGGTIRHTILHPDGSFEAVAANNLVAIMGRFCVDVQNNKFGAYFVLPDDFWQVLRLDMRMRGVDVDILPVTASGGTVGILHDSTIFVGDTDKVLMRSDHNGLCWSFEVGDTHNLRSFQECYVLTGPNKGFDPELPYIPMLNSYAPIPLIEQWAADGLLSAQQALNTPQLYEYWEKRGQLNPGDKPLLLEGPKEEE